MSLATFMDRLQVVSRKQFGEGKRTGSLTKKISQELEEVIAQPDDLEEWVDILILAMDGYWRHGGTSEWLLHDLHNKLCVVAERTYPKTDEDTPVQHVT